MSREVIAGLLKRRSELAAEADALRARTATVVTDLRRLDAVILQFDPGFDPRVIARPKRLRGAGAAARGEMARFLLGELREAGGLLTAPELARRLAAARAAAGTPCPPLGTLTRRLGMALRLQELNGALRATREVAGNPLSGPSEGAEAAPLRDPLGPGKEERERQMVGHTTS